MLLDCLVGLIPVWEFALVFVARPPEMQDATPVLTGYLFPCQTFHASGIVVVRVCAALFGIAGRRSPKALAVAVTLGFCRVPPGLDGARGCHKGLSRGIVHEQLLVLEMPFRTDSFVDHLAQERV